MIFWTRQNYRDSKRSLVARVKKDGRSIKMVRHRELFIYLFVCLFWLCWVFVAVCGLSLVAVSGVSSETILYDSVIMDT